MSSDSQSRCESMRLNVLRSFQASAEQQTPQDSTQQQIVGRRLMSAMPAVPVSCSECVELQDVDAYLAIGPVEVVLCASIRNERQLREVLLHELVHAYDFSTGRCDFTSCEGLAYSEVRAARAGNCSSYFPMAWMRDNCIRNQAVASTAILFGPDRARICVDKVFAAASRDSEPFGD